MSLKALLLGAASGALERLRSNEKPTDRFVYYRGRKVAAVSKNAQVGGSEVKDVLMAYAKERDLNFAKMDLGDVEIK